MVRVLADFTRHFAKVDIDVLKSHLELFEILLDKRRQLQSTFPAFCRCPGVVGNVQCRLCVFVNAVEGPVFQVLQTLIWCAGRSTHFIDLTLLN
ncbi:hypothetical protein D3C86_1711360 [compost metagenome]